MGQGLVSAELPCVVKYPSAAHRLEETTESMLYETGRAAGCIKTISFMRVGYDSDACQI